jgi:hypothetical protein
VATLTNSTQNISSVTIDPSEAHYNDLLPDISDLFPLKRNLLSHVKFNKAVQKLSSYLREIPDVQRLRTNYDLIQRIANIIENFAFKSKSVDKKALLIAAFQIVFKLNAAEISIISDFIEYIHSNKLIKKLTTSKFIYRKSKKILVSFLKF